MRTPLCCRLGLRVPLIQAPMNWATDARLVAAVSNAGGLGSLGPNAGASEPVADPRVTGERLRREIRETRRLTDRPFAVNVPIGSGNARAYSDGAIDILLEERVGIAIVCMGGPDVYTARLKAAGVFVIHAVASVRHARKAEEAGVDAVVAEGFDGGGHSGFDELPMAVLVPQVVEAVRLPVIAAGGVVDGRGLVMALAAGAEAAYMGSRFLASLEAPIHDDVKQAIVAAGDTDTTSWGRRTGVARTLRNAFARRYRELELAGASREELDGHVDDYSGRPGGRRVAGLKHGDLEQGEIYLGAGAGMIRDVLSCAEIIERTMQEAELTIGRLQRLRRSGED
jgi:NAD(P)H-dependent flavin oxidoreductase YrpB (nitropropane dioxygenase family)